MKQLIHEQYIEGALKRLHLLEPEIYVDNEARGRSGHVGHAMTEFAPGKIIAFNSNTSAKLHSGHSPFGWIEYRISEDYGKSWGKINVLDYSVKEFVDGIQTIAIEKAVTCEDGSIVAFCLTCEGKLVYEPYGIPRVIRSEDGGKTWSEAKEMLNYKGRVYDAIYHEGSIYVLEFSNDDFLGKGLEHLYRIIKSDDNGKSFYEHSVVSFPSTESRGYGNMIFTPENTLLVYVYNANDEVNMDCIKSDDLGKTWNNYVKCYVDKKIRNPQIGFLDGQYILHGRAGESEAGTGSFVIYTSLDGINWSQGEILVEGRPACFYSNNIVIKCADGKNRMLVQYSENYNDPAPGKWSGQVNVMHMWIESN